jgi:3-oxoacyl-(acyl-carrier-protein) synthase
MKRRVVVTGLGVVSPIGTNVPVFSKALEAGVSGEGPITSFDTSSFPVKRAYEVKNFDPKSYGAHALDPFIQYAVAATEEAVRSSGFDVSRADPYRVGISVSSSKGGVRTIDRFRDRFEKNRSALLGARIYTNAVPNFAAQWIARRWKINGPAKCYVAACATGTVAVIEGARMVETGVVDYCIAGASDASLTPLMLAGYRNMGALSSAGLLPFDKRRAGFVIGEGAGIVFLETLESAESRKAKIYGEILGYGYGNDPFDPVKYNREGDALAQVLKKVTERCRLFSRGIGYVNLHGTGTPAGDLYETEQIKRVFGKQAGRIPMSSIKSMTGHLLGASGAVEMIAALAAMERGFIPPTIGLESPDPECDLDYTPIKSRAVKFETALSLSMGFGGHIAVIGLGKVGGK